ncbi:hypothetical protein SAMN04515672_2369 [Natronorubrum texcoconense]|uniref:Uncharacterized protein n=1 Tax=Natronorubrum texcoconense TaxID=1095776 RepID=A0A1G8ZN37_9EURY|nr:hypothetical protein SAMN04515672_2369 [Natronorubrum texcoconense]
MDLDSRRFDADRLLLPVAVACHDMTCQKHLYRRPWPEYMIQ